MSLISRLFRRSPRKGAADAPAPLQAPSQAPPPAGRLSPIADEVSEPHLLQPPAPELQAPSPAEDIPAPAPTPEGDQDEAEGGDLEEAGDPGEEDSDDPYIGAGEPLQISLPTADGVAQARRTAEQLALEGPQRVTLVDPAGPGSLAETLVRLEAEGRLTSEIIDDPEDGPYILYRPLS